MNREILVLLSAGLGVMAGWVCGDEARRRKYVEAKVEDLRLRLVHTTTSEQRIKEMHSVLNDAHKHILAVSKPFK